MLGILGTSKFGTSGNFGISGIGGKLGGVGNLGNPFFSFGFFSTCFFLNFGIGGSDVLHSQAFSKMLSKRKLRTTSVKVVVLC